MCGERICGLISAFKYNPDALPFSFSRICAPSGTSAWCAMLETHLIPRALSRSFNDASSSAFLRNSKPSNLATTSRVMSSLVGPSPPVTKTISARENNSQRLSPIAAPSPTVRRSSIRKPSAKISRAIKARCVSCTSPARSSVPVLRRTARMSATWFVKKLQRYKGSSNPFNLVTLLTFLTCGRRPSGGVFVLLLANQRQLFAFDHSTINRDFSDIFPTRHVIHDVEHDPLQHRAKRASTGTLRDRLRGQSAQRVFGHRQPYTFHREELGVLLDHSVLCLSQNCHHLFFS